jgi:hypothetical protein
MNKKMLKFSYLFGKNRHDLNNLIIGASFKYETFYVFDTVKKKNVFLRTIKNKNIWIDFDESPNYFRIFWKYE